LDAVIDLSGTPILSKKREYLSLENRGRTAFS
jgi:hypothetical protein